MQIIDWKHISKPFHIYKPILISSDTYVAKMTYDNSLFSIQTPKLMIYSKPTRYKHTRYTLSLCCHNYKYNPLHQSFIKSLKNIEYFVQSILPKLHPYLNISTNSYKFVSSIHLNTNWKNAYFDVQIPIIQDKPITSVYNHHKIQQDIDYIQPGSSSLNIITLHHIWFKDNKYGLQWILYQSKIFQPIQQLEECIIQDDYDEDPLCHYHNISNHTDHSSNTDQSNNENHPIFGKYIKMKRMGVPEKAIQYKLSLENLSIDNLNNYIEKQIVPPLQYDSSKPTVVQGIQSSLLQNVQLRNIDILPKITKKQVSKNNVSNSTQSFIPTMDELQYIILNLKKPP